MRRVGFVITKRLATNWTIGIHSAASVLLPSHRARLWSPVQWIREITCVHLVPTFRTHGTCQYFSVYRHRVTLNNVNAIILRFVAHIIPEGTQTMVFPLFIFRPLTFETILVASSSDVLFCSSFYLNVCFCSLYVVLGL